MPKTLEVGLEAVFNSGVLGPGADALYRQGRYAELGLEILSTVGPSLALPGSLDAIRKQNVLVATECLRSVGDGALAAGHLLFALRMRKEAEGLLEQEGLSARVKEVAGEWSLATLMPQGKSSPARVPHLRALADLARSLGQHLRAASFYEWGGMPYEAALSRLAGRDESGAVSLLLRVPMSGPLYRRACLRAVSLAGQLDLLSPELEAFLEPFISGEILDEDEARALYLWARHLWNRSFGQAAGRTLKRLLAARPDHAAASELLGRIEKTEAPGRHGGRILEDEASFRGRDRPEMTHRVRDTAQPKPRFAPPPVPPAPELPDPLAVWRASTLPHLAPQPTQTLDRVPAGNSTPPDRPAVSLVSLAPGMTIAGRYRLGPKLGRGGTAVVFQATDMEMREEIAIKIFTSHELDPAMNERFKRELRLSRQLSHPDILRLYDLGFFAGHLYITMELLTGAILRQRLAGGRLDPVTAVRYLAQLCDGLQAMHDLGIVHRDLKPENLFVTRDDRIKIMDLGIAKKMAASNLTSHGWLWGTPRYMSPEQISDFSRVTASADLYSLGVVAYEMLTGAVPFDHPDVESVMVMQLRERPVPPRTANPQVPPALDELVMQLLEKAPERRPKTCREVRGRLDGIGQPRPQ